MNLDHELYQITHPELKVLAEYALRNAPAYFWTCRASRNHHPPDERGEGGTILHLKRAFKTAKYLCRAFSLEGFDRQLVLTAVLIHDICKEGTSDEGVGYTVGGHERLLGVRFSEVPQVVENRLWLRVDRLVRSHEGIWGEKKPETLMERIVHLADYISTREDIIVQLD